MNPPTQVGVPSILIYVKFLKMGNAFSKALQLKSDSKRRLFAQPLTCFVPSKLKASLNQELVAWCKKPLKASSKKNGQGVLKKVRDYFD